MATYHSLNIALGVITSGLEKGFNAATGQVRRFAASIAGIETGASLQGLVKGGAGVWAAMRAVDALGEGAKELREQIRGTRFETQGLVTQLEAASRSTATLRDDFNKYNVLGPIAVSPGRAIYNFLTNQGLPRDAAADAAAERSRLDLLKSQAEWAEKQRIEQQQIAKVQERQANFDQRRIEMMHGFNDEQRRSRMGPRQQGVFDLFRSEFGHGVEPDAGMMARARGLDLAERSRQRAESRLSRSLALLAGEQGVSHGGRSFGGSTPALLLGSREEYIARVKSMQHSDPDKQDERRHRREVEKAIRETNKWLQKLLQQTPMPGTL